MSDVITVKEVLDYATEFDMCRLAHQVFWAVSTNKVMLTDNSDRLLEIDYEAETIREMTDRNMLCIGRIKLYVIKSYEQYAFYFANNPLEASMLHREKFGEATEHITEAKRLLTKVMYFADIDLETAMIDYRKSIVQFPAYLGHAAPGKYILHRLDKPTGGRKIV